MIFIKSFNYHLKIKTEEEREKGKEDKEWWGGGVSQELNPRARKFCCKISILLKSFYFPGLTITHIRV